MGGGEAVDIWEGEGRGVLVQIKSLQILDVRRLASLLITVLT